jgi:spermidine synthase
MPSIQISEERGVRYLHFGSRWIQGAMRMSRPFHLELEYTREMMLPLVARDERSWPQRVLMIGLGAGSLAKFVHRHRPQAAVTIVELREDVVTAAAQFFRLPDDPDRLDIVLGDGAEYVRQPGPRFDLVLVDGYDARGRVGTLDTTGFYHACRARMRGDAMLATNLLTRHRGVEASLARLREAFDGRAMALPPTASGNVVVLAAVGAPVDLSPASIAPRADALRRETGLGLAATLNRIARTPHDAGYVW